MRQEGEEEGTESIVYIFLWLHWSL